MHTPSKWQSQAPASLESRACGLYPWAMQCIHAWHLLLVGVELSAKFHFTCISVCCSRYSRPSNSLALFYSSGFSSRYWRLMSKQVQDVFSQVGWNLWHCQLPLGTDVCVCVCGTCSGEEKGHCIRCSQMGIEISLKTHKGGGIIKASLSTTEHLPVEHLPPEHQELVSWFFFFFHSSPFSLLFPIFR